MIIGLTGSLASGKGTFANFLKEKGFVYLSLSNELRELAKEEKIPTTRENLQNFGNQLREKYGVAYLAEIVVNKINNQEYKNAIVDSIRNPGEITVLRRMKNFFLIAIDAPREMRYQRIVNRDRKGYATQTWGDFLKADNRDKGIGENETGQAVQKCIDLADFKFINDTINLEEANEKFSELFEQIYKKIPRPSWDEYFLEISRAVARRATCDRGRAGCVIAKDKQILVSGYVGSPKGLPHCDEVGHQMKKTVHEDGHETQHCVRTTHAEQNAICQAAKLGVPINGATLYCNMTPCSVCAKMIINAGIKRVVCSKKYHAGQESEDMFHKAGVELEILSKDVETYPNM